MRPLASGAWTRHRVTSYPRIPLVDNRHAACPGHSEKSMAIPSLTRICHYIRRRMDGSLSPLLCASGRGDSSMGSLPRPLSVSPEDSRDEDSPTLSF